MKSGQSQFVRSCIIIPLLFIGLCIAACVVFYVGLTFGQISGFKSIVTSNIPNTGYAFNVIPGWMDTVWLENSSSGTKTNLGGGIKTQYTILEHQNRRYLILKAYGGGTDGRYDYAIWNITEATPVFIGSEGSCDDPKLSGNALLFNYHGKCRFLDFPPYDKSVGLN